MSNFGIRGGIDGRDGFMSGHSVRSGGARGSSHALRLRMPPAWIKSDEKIQALLLRAFPKLLIDEKQRRRAAIWARVIYLYYRSGYTYSEIAEEMNLKSNTSNRPFQKVERILKSIRYASRGLNAKGYPRGKSGRPRKIVP